MAETISQKNDVYSLLVPMFTENALLLPNVAVAEVVPSSDILPAEDEDTPEWFLGSIIWRGTSVPLIWLENFIDLESDKPDFEHCRFAVLNTLNGDKEIPFVAILTNGLPRLRHVREQNLQLNPDDLQLADGIATYALFDGTPVLVPDIDVLEKSVKGLK